MNICYLEVMIVIQNLNHGQSPVVGAVIGAFMLISRRVVEVIGMLDEDFFFTVEDIDYCFRVNEANFKIYYDPTVSMIHLVSASQKGIEYQNSIQIVFYTSKK